MPSIDAFGRDHEPLDDIEQEEAKLLVAFTPSEELEHLQQSLAKTKEKNHEIRTAMPESELSRTLGRVVV
ncbi:hypothetical protein V492_05334 [Pseudogymnoascus sp. VKM F-4246]|nr:hypothetical protein V492_05334 [Pseudogymnoascus sp. VKM F-4246]